MSPQSLKTSEVESHTLRERVDDLETRLTDDQRALMMSRTQSESQRRESSELLLTVFQNVNKILGAEVRSQSACPPADLIQHAHCSACFQDRTTPANFGLFRETLLMRIGSLGKLQVDFEKKVKLCEQAFADKLKYAPPFRLVVRRTDGGASAGRSTASLIPSGSSLTSSRSWSAKSSSSKPPGRLASLRSRENSRPSLCVQLPHSLPLDQAADARNAGCQSKHADLSSQYTALKGLAKSDSSSELKALTTRNATLERRLANAQNQLTTYDDKMESARQKMSTAETRWDARVKEYERIIKAGEERVKSEKQGGKERAAQLEGQVK